MEEDKTARVARDMAIELLGVVISLAGALIAIQQAMPEGPAKAEAARELQEAQARTNKVLEAWEL